MLFQCTVCSLCCAADFISIHVDSKDTVLSVLRCFICAEWHCLFWFKCPVNARTDLKIFLQADFSLHFFESKEMNIIYGKKTYWPSIYV